MSNTASVDSTAELLRFLDASPTPYHAVAEAVRQLSARGFVELDEREQWRIEPGLRGYVVRGGGTVVAFVMGSDPPAQAGFVMLGAHTDSPNLRLKPLPDVDSVGYLQIGVEVYGGVLFSTWLDRDLSIAGRVTLRGGETRLVKLERPVCRIPNLAIHLDREVNTRGLVLNPQTHLLPMLGIEPAGKEKKKESILRPLIAAELERAGQSAAPDDILGYDLCLYDVARASLGGMDGELVFSARLDNLASCHAALEALLAATSSVRQTRVIALYDHEEIGSLSAAGARSRFLESLLDRLASGFQGSGRESTSQAFARSLLVSADMAHAVHPNYADKHDRQHRPLIGRGPVLKTNASQSYATDAPGAAAFSEACREIGFEPQHFVSRADIACGSTIGPISAARLGIRTVDVGNPMLSMHSCRELGGALDVEPMIRALTELFVHPPGIDPRS
jgi:aspartyl aminopeptidase